MLDSASTALDAQVDGAELGDCGPAPFAPEGAPSDADRYARLWRHVLAVAIRDALGDVDGVPNQRERDDAIEDARLWIAEGGEDFRLVCELAGLDPDYALPRLRAAIGLQ